MVAKVKNVSKMSDTMKSFRISTLYKKQKQDEQDISDHLPIIQFLVNA